MIHLKHHLKHSEEAMSERTRRDLVTFLHAFSIGGVEEEQRPGTYTVETLEEQLDAPTVAIYRRVSTTILLPSLRYGNASMQAVTIDPRDLEAAKKKDAETASDAGGSLVLGEELR